MKAQAIKTNKACRLSAKDLEHATIVIVKGVVTKDARKKPGPVPRPASPELLKLAKQK